MIVEIRGISMDVVEIVTTLPNLMPTSQKRYAMAAAHDHPIRRIQSNVLESRASPANDRFAESRIMLPMSI